MARARSITDDEVALIRAMLAREMPNKDIQFYFNRPDRAVNSGRISDIKTEKYAPGVQAASNEQLDGFLSAAPRYVEGAASPATGTLDPSSEDAIRQLFRNENGCWRLLAGETDRYECKENVSFRPLERFVPALRSIAGLANNKGGYVFFGVRDKTFEVVGLPDDRFETLDLAEFSRSIGGCFDPAPSFAVTHLVLGGARVTAIYVEQSVDKPIVATKQMKDFAEGGIYFRYPGESKLIKPGELRRIIVEREHKAVAEFSRKMRRMVEGTIATLDLESGRVEGRGGGFLVEPDLLSMMQFVREGEFSERDGAPTLKLLGEAAFKPTPVIKERIVREAVTDQATILNFLNREPVAHPREYILHSCHSARRWLPIFYYLQASGESLEAMIAFLAACQSTQNTSKAYTLGRLRGARSAFEKATGAETEQTKAMLLDGTVAPPTTMSEAGRLARALIALESPPADFDGAAGLLLTMYKLTAGTASSSFVFRAACRLDELQYSPHIAR